MSRSLQWRKFAFFEKEVVCENVEARLGGERVTCATAESGTLLLGDAGGSISIADRNFQFDRKCKAFRGEVSGVRLLLDGAKSLRQFVVAVGDDAKADGGDGGAAAAPQYVVKVFNINDLARPVHAFHVNGNVAPEATVTAFAALPDGSQLAVGFSNSTVLLFSAPFLRSDHAPIRQLAPTVLSQQARGFPVAGLHFCVLAPSTGTSAAVASSSSSSSSTSASSSSSSSSSSATAGAQGVLRTRLFAVFDTQHPQTQPLPQHQQQQQQQQHSQSQSQTSGGVIVYDTSPSSSRRAPSVLDDAGCAAGCSSYMAETRELVVGRDEGVFSYSSEDRGGAAGFEGSKQCVATVGRHILVCAADEKTKRSAVTIYDLRNKFISCSSPLPAGDRVARVLTDGGLSYVLTSSQTLLRFREKDVTNKIEVLTKKGLFPLAIALAAEEQCEAGEVMGLYKTYADQLYERGEFDASVTQYCHAAGYLQPSYVVRRFLTSQRMGNLVTYLEHLLDRGLASNDHVELLLTCYSKEGARDEGKVTALVSRVEAVDSPAPARADVRDRTASAAGLTAPRPVMGGPASRDRSSSAALKQGAGAGAAGLSQPASTITYNHTNNSGSADGAKPYQVVHFSVDACFHALVAAGWGSQAALLAERFGRSDLRLKLAVTQASASASASSSSSSPSPSSSSSSASSASGAGAGTKTTEGVGSPQALQDALAILSEVALSLSSASASASGPDSLTLMLLDHAPALLSTSAGAAALSSLLARLLSAGGKAGEAVSHCVEQLMPLYAGRDAELLPLLEAYVSAGSPGSRVRSSPRVAMTLLELYLGRLEDATSDQPQAQGQRRGGEERAVLEERVYALLDTLDPDTHDLSHALLLCHVHGLRPAAKTLLPLQDPSTNGDLLLRMLIEDGDVQGVFKLLRRDGASSPHLYEAVLRFFLQRASPSSSSSSSEAGAGAGEAEEAEDREERWADVSKVLSLVEDEEALPPAAILSVLAACPSTQLGVARSYIHSSLSTLLQQAQDLQREVTAAHGLVESLAEEQRQRGVLLRQAMGKVGSTVMNVAQGLAGKNRPAPASASASGSTAGTKATAGAQGRSLNPFGPPSNNNNNNNNDDDEDEDEEDEDEQDEALLSDLAAVEARERDAERAKWEGIRGSMLRRGADHEAFFAELESSPDGFSTVAAAFGKISI